MSWFTEIAGKAEDLLNKVDQTAATALQNKSKSTYKSSGYVSSHGHPFDTNFEQTYSGANAYIGTEQSLQQTSVISNKSGDRKLSYSPTSSMTNRKKAESDDEKLLRFLNETEPFSAQKKKIKEIPKVKKNADNTYITTDTTNVKENTVEEEACQNEQTVPQIESVNIKESISEPVKCTENTEEKYTSELSSLPLKSKMMELPESSAMPVTEELLLVQKRAEHAEAEMKRMTKKLDHWNSQISGNDKLVRELREKERDMIAALDAKDSQLAILKVRLQEADQELQAKRNIIESLRAENERIIKEHADNAAFQNKTIEILQGQSQQAESELNKTREAFLQSQTEHMQQMSKMEEEHKHLVESYSSLQKKWNEVNEKNKELLSQLKAANGNLEMIQQEYSDYKQKAQRILQSKEKLISSIKEGHLELNNIEKNEASSALLNAEIESIKQERDFFREELRRANELLETYRSEIQEMEKISQNDLASAQEQCRILKEQLEMEKMQNEEMHLLNNQLKEEMQFLREDLTRAKSNFHSRLQDREIEIEKLRRQLTAKSLSSVSQDELESRLHALTENLIQKQTLVEALSTEKNSLVLQLERLEQQLRDAQNFGMQQHAFVGINNNETELKTKAMFLENSFDSPLTRKVKRVYGSIDSFSIRLGVFFRRYPMTRVFIIIYMVMFSFMD
ncbi:golgin subfamily A member 5-like isoform X2 [Stegodyphus dumicola]|uniref:golgin subfamily A member 5-like isoform X2 n=1 Tax=Stegodyphus dumicola TaxID=202533 RepID=UPI0015ACCF75|nr:golgin subfamily A member 5-like isoform X2 [Stegodyphus dumicola]